MRSEFFFDLIKLAIGKFVVLSERPSFTDWDKAFCLSKKHALVGVLWAAIEHLPKEQHPPK